MDCPVCGYFMDDLTVECPRCARMAAVHRKGAIPRAARRPSPPPSNRLLVMCLLMLILMLGISVSLLFRSHPQVDAEARTSPPRDAPVATAPAPVLPTRPPSGIVTLTPAEPNVQPDQSDMPTPAPSRRSGREVIHTASQSVVMLGINDKHGGLRALGSGFFVGNGVIATSAHVLIGGTGVAKIINQQEYLPITRVLVMDKVNDLALLQVAGGNAPALPLGDEKQASVGDVVYVIGNPEGFEGTASSGILSGFRTRPGASSLIQISAPVSPGSSGGPILDEDGRVIGIVSSYWTQGQNLNFGVPVSYLRRLMTP